MISAVRTGSLSGCRLLWVPLLAWFFHASVALADPSWAGGPATTVQRFDFTTNDETVAPDAAMNPLGGTNTVRVVPAVRAIRAPFRSDST